MGTRAVILIAALGCSQPAVRNTAPPLAHSEERDAAVAPPPVALPSQTQLVAGGHHTCLLDHEELWCWGKNDNGQLGDGTRAEQVVPERVKPIEHPVAIALGGNHTCALDPEGAVWCWGQIERDESDAAVDVLAPKQIVLPAPAVELGAGMDHTCARLADRRVACWGGSERESYELGGAGADHVLPGLSDVTSLRVGVATSCVLRGGKVLCWGGHWSSGFLGAEHGKFAPTPTEIPELAGATEVAPGAEHVCAVIGGKVKCRGINLDNKLGDPKVPCCKLATSDVPDLADVRALRSSFDYTCALRATGAVTCWGRLRGFAKTWSFDTKAVQVAPGYQHGCYLNGAREVWCWGEGDNGQVGIGISARVPSPTKVIQLDDAVELALGYIHTCARRRSGAVACWGPSQDQSVPRDVPSLGTADHVTSGVYETCALRGATVTCIQRSRDYKPGVVKFPGKGKLRAFAHGGAGICAALSNGTVACAHEMSDAHVIPGDLPERTATLVAGFKDVVRVWSDEQVCGASKTELKCSYQGEDGWGTPKLVPGVVGADVITVAGTCFLMRDGRVGCRGYDAAVTWRSDISDATALATGEGFHCVVRKGKVWCWGANNSGQLGRGIREYSGERHDSPLEVANLDGVLEIGAGEDQACARTKGAVYCWGSNESGRLGIGTSPTTVTTPAQVAVPAPAR